MRVRPPEGPSPTQPGRGDGETPSPNLKALADKVQETPKTVPLFTESKNRHRIDSTPHGSERAIQATNQLFSRRAQ